MPTVERLYNYFHPESYQLILEPDLNKLKFKAQVIITGNLTSASNTIKLHGHRLVIKSATVKQSQLTQQAIAIKASAKNEQISLRFKAKLSKAPLELHITYTGIIETKPHGLYRSSYKEGGKEKYLLASQLESIHARGVLPSIDEPVAKAVFQLSVLGDKDFTVVSNTLVEHETIQNGKKLTTFKKTPRMSSYLLAVIGGNWKYRQTKTNSGTIIRTYAIASQVKFANDSLKTAKHALEFYESYFGVPYPLENLNQIAIPDMEPGVGAMENWGCVVYRADSLLIDPAHTSQSMRIYNLIVIAHELAHMWFGNLVTMAWWDDLWLNEGFASWIEYKAADVIQPGWHMWREFVSNDMLRALHQDSYATTHPVYSVINHPLQIAEIFDDITYRKGSSSIRMLEQYLGEETFRRGLQTYIKKFAYQNATRNDLWKTLEKVSGKPVAKFMDKWLKQAGHPVVTYSRTGNKIRPKQQIFRYNLPKRATSVTWPVPLSVYGQKDKFDFNGGQVSYTLKKNPKLLKFNANQGGFYRVSYNQPELATLAEAIANNKLPALDTIGVLADQHDLTMAGIQNISSLLDLLIHAKTQQIAEVWDQISTSIGSITLVFGSDELEDAITGYVHNLIGQLYKKFGWNGLEKRSHNDKNLQLTILGLSAHYKYADAPAKVTYLYKAMQSAKKINPDLREIALVSVARDGNRQDYQRLMKWHKQTHQSEEQRRLARALCSFKQPEFAHASLKFMRSKNVRIQDAYAWLIYLLRNRYSREIAWQYFKKEWKWIHGTYGRSIVMKHLVEAAVGSFSEKAMLKEVRQFFKAKNTHGYTQGIRNGLDVITFHANWKKRDSKELFTYLSKYR